jgi:hypothetical protein
MLDPADRRRLAQFLAMGSSAHAGERDNALRLADRMVREHKTTWEEMLLPGAGGNDERELQRQLDIATAACKQLQLENEQLQRLLTRAAHAAAHGANGSVSHDNHTTQAKWVLGLAESGAFNMSSFETEFCESISNWTSALTPKQQAVFARILTAVHRVTGQRPPP